jgi:uncharacterized membrane protein
MPDSKQDLPPHIAETVQTITSLHAEHHRNATAAERIIDRTTAFIGRPVFLFGFALVSIVWALGNVLVEAAGGMPPDPAPFAWMGLALTWAALLIAILILTSQRRADRLAELREQMNLEATLLSEQKTRKIIELLEELRRDTPQVHDRTDPEAAQMAAKSDPHEVLGVIKERANDAVRARGLSGTPPSEDRLKKTD